MTRREEVDANLVLLQDARIQVIEVSGLNKITAGRRRRDTNVMPQYLQLPVLGLT